MSNNKQLYIDFEAYERMAEPHKQEKASAWRTAIGLQDVDGLKVSDYLRETAVRHIEGDITIDDVRERLKSYYINKTTHDKDDEEKEEADRVAANITKLLSEKSFSFTALTPVRDKIAISCMLIQIREFSSHAITHELYIKNRKRLFCL